MKNNPRDYLDSIAATLLSFFKSEFIKQLTSKLIAKLGWSATGFQGWLAEFIVKNAYKYVAKPVAELMIRKGFLIYDKTAGKFRIKKINKAKEENDAETYWDNISDI